MQGRRKVLEEDHDSVSHFIWCVKKRPPLYNYKLPAQQRRRADVARIWQELANEIGNVTAAECRKKWKNLRDTYHQYRLRKLKYKECLEKWRYTSDLSFLTDIYQPKLKSERANYLNSSHRNTIHEVKTSDISSLIELDEEETIEESEPVDKDLLVHQTENVFDDNEENIEHEIDIDENEMQFCDVSGENVKQADGTNDDTYGEVYLYEEADCNVADSLVLPTNQPDSKESIIKRTSSCNTNYTEVFDGASNIECRTPPPVNENLTIGNRKDELDLFFQFLKTKIQNLPSVDITAIQIEFLNAVLRRESANLENANTS